MTTTAYMSCVQGSLANGEYCGKGEYRFSDGSKYQGDFTNNMYVHYYHYVVPCYNVHY